MAIVGAMSMTLVAGTFVFAGVAIGGVPEPVTGAADVGNSILSFATSAQSDGHGNEV